MAPSSLEDLRELPSLEQRTEALTQMVGQVEQRLAAELGLSDWSTSDEGSQALCDDGQVEGARMAFLPTRLLPGGVADASWRAAVDVLVEVAGPYGFGAAETVVDNPGEHEVVLHGERESLIRFGTLQNATLDVLTGCHLTEAARDQL